MGPVRFEGGTAVHCSQGSLKPIKTVLLLAMLGIAGVVLAGPAIALASVLLAAAVVVGALALVGLVFWMIFLVIIRGPRLAWKSAGALATSAWRATGRIAVLPWQVARGTARLAARVPGLAWRGVRFAGRTAVGAMSVVVPGLLAGAAVGVVFGLMDHDLDEAVPMNAVAGAAIALTLGIVFKLRDLRRPVGRAIVA
jgi:hypothetical protein